MKTILLILSLLLAVQPVFSLNPGSALWYSGFHAGITGQGFAGVASKGSGFYSLINPAVAASTYDMRIFTSGSLELPNYGLTAGLSSPISPGGIFYTATQFLSYDGTIMTRMGYGKQVRSDFSLGLEGIVTINTQPNIYAGGGLGFGMLWHPEDPKPFNEGWGFKDFSFGSVIRMIFFPTGYTENNPIPLLTIQNGIEATFMDIKPATWKFIVDYSIGVVPLSFKNGSHFITWGAIGTSFTFWEIWEISLGTILGTFNLGFGNNPVLPFTFGTSIGYKWDVFSIRGSYSLGGHQFFNDVEMRHTIGLELGFGDRKPKEPRAFLKFENGNDTNYISPNGDLLQDSVTLSPFANGDINAWKLSIESSKGIVVRTYEGNQENYEPERHAGTFLKTYFTPNKSEIIPEKITWDGKDQNNQIVADDTYHAILSIRYREDKISHSTTNTIVVDTKAPTAKITLSAPTLYLGDNPSEKLEFYQELSNDPWSVVLIDQSDQSRVANWVWHSEEIPLTNSWQLKNPLRVNVSSGKYSYIASSYDKAGNFTEVIISNINIETKPRKPKISSDEKTFSPNGDDCFDFVKIFYDYKATLGVTTAQTIIYNSKGDAIHTNMLDPEKLPPINAWNGKDKNGEILPNGIYFLVLELIYDDNTTIHSEPLIINLDTAPPSFTLEYSPERFSPDKDGINDVLHIDIKAEDSSGIGDWTVSILDNSSNKLESFYSRDAEKLIAWNPPRDLLNTGDRIFIYFEIRDAVQNKLDYTIADIRIDTLLDPYDKNLIMKKNYTYFKEGQAVLDTEIYNYLDETWESVKHYPSDKIIVSARADFSEAQNSEYEAYRLAILRGEAIKAYFIHKGFKADQISLDVKTAKETTQIRKQDMRRIKIYLEKDPETLKK